MQKPNDEALKEAYCNGIDDFANELFKRDEHYIPIHCKAQFCESFCYKCIAEIQKVAKKLKGCEKMSVKYEDECCGCATESYPYRCSACPNRHVKHLYCDKCGEDVERLYDFDGKELCGDCVLKELEVIE